MYDVVIIGGGIVGCSVASELSKYAMDTLLLEKGTELATGTSKANSGIVHAGFDCKVNTLKAKLNVEGNQMFAVLSEKLDFPFKRNGSLVLAFSKDERGDLEELLERGKKNGVPDLQILEKEAILEMEPKINKNVVAALHAPTGGITSPYEAVYALAEHAYSNGVQFYFETEVKNIIREKDIYRIITNQEELFTKCIVNCAGLYSDEVNNFVSEKKYEIKPRKGEYILFDRIAEQYVDKTIFQLPTAKGKGILVTPTVHGNLLVGPSSEYIQDKTATETTGETLAYVLETALKSVEQLPTKEIVTSFTGLRAKVEEYDFILEEAYDCKGLINAIGIDSPGLTAAPAIGRYIKDMVVANLQPEEKTDFIETREGIKSFQKLSMEEQNKLIQENEYYGHIICRCETVTEGELVDAIHRNLGATTVDGIKRRTRTGMGRCQGGFCGTKVLDILARELDVMTEEVTKFGGNSFILNFKR